MGTAVGSILILVLTSCGTREDNGKPDFKANSNTRAELRSKFEHNTNSSDGNTEPISVPKPLNNRYRRMRSRNDHVILTPYIKNNRIKEGIKAAKVSPPLLNNVRSYAGFFEVDESRESYMFFLLFPCVQRLHIHAKRIPVIVWLQGGMGSSSLFGAFRENGPIRIENDGSLTYNKYSWAEKAHLVYFDSPVGAGYSYTLKKGFSTNLQEVATNLYTALKQFITLFRLRRNPLYLASQGYGGKYVTSLGAMIHKKNELNLQGVVIGNGFIDPPNMLRYGAYMYQLGFIDSTVRNYFGVMNRRITNFLRNENDEEALELYEQWVIGDKRKGISPQICYISGLPSILNYMIDKWGVNERKLMNSYFNNQSIMKALNSGVSFTTQNDRCKNALRSNTLKSEAKHLEMLMDKYRVLLYHGQMSIKNAYPFMLNYLKKIRWYRWKEYKENKRNRWKVDGVVAGYYRTGGRFTELLIRNAGQMVPVDQPKWAQRMINNFIQKLSLNTDRD